MLAPVSASITTGVPHAVRTLNFLPIFQVFTAIGFLSPYIFIKNQDLRFKTYDLRRIFIFLCLTSYVLFSVVNVIYYLDQYFVQQNYYSSADWQYGYKQAVEEMKMIENNYNEIVISDNQPMDKSYMFFLFYLKYPPSEYQKIGENSSGSFTAHHSFGRYTFRSIDWTKDSVRKNVLYIGSPKDIPDGANTIKTIYNFDGTPAIRIVGT